MDTLDQKLFESELGKIIDISKNFGVRKVMLFGSCLDNIETAHDIDIAISGIPARDFFKYYGKVASMLAEEVDIVDLDDMRDYMRNKIRRFRNSCGMIV